jgi:pimeloyl-ACP methyl ester carboxylesterase
MDEQAEYSVLSKAAYDFFHGGEVLAQSELQEYGLGDHRIDGALSDDHAVVITRPDGSAVVSYRGTDHISDLAPDFQIALGYHQNPVLQSMGAAAYQGASDRFADARTRFGAAQEKHGRATLTGHSLGGTLALHAARHHDAKAIVFNPGSSPLAEPFHAAICSTFDCGYSQRHRIYSTGSDPISLSSYLFDRATDDVITVPFKKRDDLLSHGLVHFLPRRTGVKTAPTYLDPVTIRTGERVPFCQAFPELCPDRAGS